MLREGGSIRHRSLAHVTIHLMVSNTSGTTSFNVYGVQATHSNVRIIPTIVFYGLIVGATRLELGAFDGLVSVGQDSR